MDTVKATPRGTGPRDTDPRGMLAGWKIQRRAAVRIVTPAVVVGALVVAGAVPAFASTATQVPVENSGMFGGFGGVVAVSPTDGWAVGGNGSNGVVERFNGTRWSTVPIPDLVDHSNPNNTAGLGGVDATSATNAVAVGASGTGNTGNTAVALRWNGTAWSRSTVTKPAGASSSLKAVKAFSVNDAWAVGTTGSSALGSSLAMHFNGTAWTQSPTPSPGTKENVLTSVAGSSPSDVWAVGYLRNLPYGNRIRLPLILHWNGAAWSQVPSPDSGAGQITYLYGVAATSATDAWAVGYGSGTVNGANAFVTHWNGSAWTQFPAPSLTTLSAVTARSSTDVWAAGADSTGAMAVAHWNGTAWSLTPVPITGGTGLPALTGITVAGAGTEWAVGNQWDGTTGASSSTAFRIVG